MGERLVACCGFLGAWLLVAGPVFQASLELREQAFERERLHSAAAAVARPRPVSPWWWLLPPVKYVLERRRGHAYREQVVAQLPAADLELLVRYLNKATGWLYVGLGGLLIAVTETWNVVRVCAGPEWLFWVLVVVMTTACLLNTALSQQRSGRVGG